MPPKTMISYGRFGNAKVPVKVMVDLLYLAQASLKVIFDILKMPPPEPWEEVRAPRLVDLPICLLLGTSLTRSGLSAMMKVPHPAADKFPAPVPTADNTVALGGDRISWL